MSESYVIKLTGQDKKSSSDLENLTELLDRERFQEARELITRMLKNGREYPIINSRGYDVVMRYSHANPEKARRIAEAFADLYWPNWLA